MYLILLILWFILSGKVTLEIFLFGLVICGWLDWFMTKHMDYSIQNDMKLIAKIPRFIKYGIILVWEVIKSIKNYLSASFFLTERRSGSDVLYL